MTNIYYHCFLFNALKGRVGVFKFPLIFQTFLSHEFSHTGGSCITLYPPHTHPLQGPKPKDINPKVCFIFRIMFMIYHRTNSKTA